MQAAGIDIDNPNVSNIIVPEEQSSSQSSNNLMGGLRKENQDFLANDDVNIFPPVPDIYD